MTRVQKRGFDWRAGLAVISLCVAFVLAYPVPAQQITSDWQAQVRERVAKKDLTGALQIADQRLDQVPGDLEARAWRGRLLNWTGSREAAEKEYRIVLESAPNDTDVLQGLADVLYAQQRFAEALDIVERARALAPRSAEVHIRRGRALRALGRTSEARQAYREALALEPGNAEARAGVASVAEEPRNELRFGADFDKFNYTSHARAFTLGWRSEVNSRWTSTLVGTFYHRSGQEASRVSGALTYRLTRRDSLTAGGAVARDQGILAKREAFFEYGHGMSFSRTGFFRGMEVSYRQRWLWYDAAHVLALGPTVLFYLPRDWTWQVALTEARSSYPGLGASWQPSGSTRLSFPLHRRVSGNVFYAVGTENFAYADQIGRFAARTLGGGARIAIAQRQEVTAYLARQDRSQSRTQTSFGFSYAFRF